MNPLHNHSGDCTIYRSIINGRPVDGICTCGFGWSLVREGDCSQMYSEERWQHESLAGKPHTIEFRFCPRCGIEMNPRSASKREAWLKRDRLEHAIAKVEDNAADTIAIAIARTKPDSPDEWIHVEWIPQP